MYAIHIYLGVWLLQEEECDCEIPDEFLDVRYVSCALSVLYVYVVATCTCMYPHNPVIPCFGEGEVIHVGHTCNISVMYSG